jgi:hypothetical protein
MTGLIAAAGIQTPGLLREAGRPKSRSRPFADALFVILSCRLSGVLPFLETIETSSGIRHDDSQSMKPPEPVEPASWACMVAGLVQIWGGALQLKDFTAFGKLRPWEVRREQTLGVAEAYREIAGRSEHNGKEFARIGGLMQQCGTALEFACATDFETEDQQRRLVTANFCRGRLCPMCNWRRSQKIGAELEQVVQRYQEQNPKSAMVMLTLTERNVAAEDLGEKRGVRRSRKRGRKRLTSW